MFSFILPVTDDANNGVHYAFLLNNYPVIRCHYLSCLKLIVNPASIYLLVYLKINEINHKDRIQKNARGIITDAAGLCVNAWRRPEFRIVRLNGDCRKLNLPDRLTGRGGSVPDGNVARRIALAGEGFLPLFVICAE